MATAAAALLPALLALAQDGALDPRSSVQINLPPDSPLTLVSADLGQSRAAARGGAQVLDLHMGLSLKNASPNRIRGVTLLVLAQEFTPGGKASVAVPSLDVAPGAAFPVRIDLRLLRPLQPGSAAPVQVSLDGVLFQDLSFYGPNRLDSRRAMRVWEMEAQRDRRYFKSLLEARGPQGLQKAVLESIARQGSRPRVDVRVARGRVTSAAEAAEHEARFAFLDLPDSPIHPIEGVARISGSEARAPRIQVRNRSDKPVRYFEIGWIVRDGKGGEFWAASVPASEPNHVLVPGRTGQVMQDTSLRFSRGAGEAVIIQGMTGYVSQAEFEDGRIWIPARASLEQARLLGLVAPSPEEQRLAGLYLKKGLEALVEELRRF